MEYSLHLCLWHLAGALFQSDLQSFVMGSVSLEQLRIKCLAQKHNCSKGVNVLFTKLLPPLYEAIPLFTLFVYEFSKMHNLWKHKTSLLFFLLHDNIRWASARYLKLHFKLVHTRDSSLFNRKCQNSAP